MKYWGVRFINSWRSYFNFSMIHDYIGEVVSELVELHYGLKGRVKQLGSYSDRNFLLEVEVNAGSYVKYIVKISIKVEEDRLLLQNYIFKQLEIQNYDHGWKTPRITLTKSQQDMVTLASPNGTDFMRVLSFIQGQELGDFEDLPLHLIDEAGELAGHMSLFLEKLSMDKYVIDLTSKMKAESHSFDLLKFNEHYQKNYKYLDGNCALAVDKIKTEFNQILPILQGMPKQLVHYDICLTNLLAARRQNGDIYISGLIDFSDVFETQGILELAILGARINLYRPQPLRNMLRVIVGFNKVRKLSESEKNILFTLIKTRLAFLSLTSTSLAAQKTNDPYFQRCKNGHLLYLTTFANACTNSEFLELLEAQISNS